MNRDTEMAAVEELMRLERMPTREQLKRNDASLLTLLHSVELTNA